MESRGWGLQEQHTGWGIGTCPSNLPSLPSKAAFASQSNTGFTPTPSALHRYRDCQLQIWGPVAVWNPNNTYNIYMVFMFLLVELIEYKEPNFGPKIQLGFAQMQLQTPLIKRGPAN